MKLSFAFCTYNRADRLSDLVVAMRAQTCPIPFEILVVNNNSRDNTLAVLQGLAAMPGVPLRYVTETAQGIVPARNRAIEESRGSDILVFIDDDELPMPGFLEAACQAILDEGADCAGGKVRVRFDPVVRPYWLEDNLLGFLAEVDHGAAPLWVLDDTTPIWTCNVAYRTALFQDGLRFDQRYNRSGNGLGGGEDAVMFQALLDSKAKVRYQPEMLVDHFVESWRLKRRYFLKLHYLAGFQLGLYETASYPREVLGIPWFMFPQLARHLFKAILMYIAGRTGALRQAMNMTHAAGQISGYFHRWLQAYRKS